MIVIIIGFFMWMPGAILLLLSRGTMGGFFPSEIAAQRGEIGGILFVIGFPIFLFGLFFPSKEKLDAK